MASLLPQVTWCVQRHTIPEPKSLTMSHPRRASLLLLSSLLLSLFSSSSWAIGEASTAFLIYVPPNNDNNGRDVCLVVTALNETTTTVDIIDDDADGDSDDTVLQVPLSQGQSYILYHKDGAINDDAGGKWDGDGEDHDTTDHE